MSNISLQFAWLLDHIRISFFDSVGSMFNSWPVRISWNWTMLESCSLFDISTYQLPLKDLWANRNFRPTLPMQSWSKMATKHAISCHCFWINFPCLLLSSGWSGPHEIAMSLALKASAHRGLHTRAAGTQSSPGKSRGQIFRLQQKIASASPKDGREGRENHPTWIKMDWKQQLRTTSKLECHQITKTNPLTKRSVDQRLREELPRETNMVSEIPSPRYGFNDLRIKGWPWGMTRLTWCIKSAEEYSCGPLVCATRIQLIVHPAGLSQWWAQVPSNTSNLPGLWFGETSNYVSVLMQWTCLY